MSRKSCRPQSWIMHRWELSAINLAFEGIEAVLSSLVYLQCLEYLMPLINSIRYPSPHISIESWASVLVGQIVVACWSQYHREFKIINSSKAKLAWPPICRNTSFYLANTWRTVCFGIFHQNLISWQSRAKLAKAVTWYLSLIWASMSSAKFWRIAAP